MRYLGAPSSENLSRFEPVVLREQVQASWAREAHVQTAEEFAQLMADQLPFHFADPLDPRIADYLERTKDTVYAPDVLRTFSANGYGGIEVEDRLGRDPAARAGADRPPRPNVHGRGRRGDRGGRPERGARGSSSRAAT